MEVTKTLKVEDLEGAWNITWLNEKTERNFHIEKKLIPLYKRGDSKNSNDINSEGYESIEGIAKEFSAYALDIKMPGPDFYPVPNRRIFVDKYLINSGVLAILGFFLADPTLTGAFFALLLMLSLILEGAIRNKLSPYLSLAIAAAILFIAPLPALFFSGQLFFLHFLNPNKEYRRFYCAGYITIFIISIFFLGSIDDSKIQFSIISIFLLILSVATLLLRWLIGAHFLLVPLVLPMVFSSFALVGLWVPASVAIFICFFSSLFSFFGSYFSTKAPNSKTNTQRK